MGYEPLDGADSLLVPANLMPLNIAGDEEEPKDEPDTDPMTEEEQEERTQQEEQEEVQLDNDMQSADEELDEVIKAESDIDTVPTDGMVTEAKRGIEWRKNLIEVVQE